MGIGGWEVLVILFVVLIVFGPKRIPGAARDVGKAMRELRRVGTEFQRELNLSAIDEDEKKPARREADPPQSPAGPVDPS